MPRENSTLDDNAVTNKAFLEVLGVIGKLQLNMSDALAVTRTMAVETLTGSQRCLMAANSPAGGNDTEYEDDRDEEGRK